MMIRTTVSDLRPGDVLVVSKRVVDYIRPVVGGAFEVVTFARPDDPARERVVWHGQMNVRVVRA